MSLNARSRPRRAGFTLIEVLIALVLVSLLSGLIFQVLSLSARAWDATEQRTATAERLRGVTGFLQRTLAQSVPLSFNDVDGRRLVFDGDDTRLRFVGRLPAHRGPDELYLLTLASVPQLDGRRRLEFAYARLTEEALRAAPEELPAGQTKVLLEGLADIEFEYFGPQGREGENAWRSDWLEAQRLPRLLRLRLEDPDRRWPDLVVPLYADGLMIPPQMTFSAAETAAAAAGTSASSALRRGATDPASVMGTEIAPAATPYVNPSLESTGARE
jgi:general secretion pathway protein J